MPGRNRNRRTVLGGLPLPERAFVADTLRAETVGGIVLLVAAAAALLWANTPVKASYTSVADFHFGIEAFGLNLSVAHWTADGLLTIFFFVAGAELKRDLVIGELRHRATAALIVVAAVCGMIMPALVYGVVSTSAGGTWNGWAVPMATDIAFALGVLAVINTHMPSALRAFLLTLAVVDDLGAIVVIALFFTSAINFAALAGAALGLGLFAYLHHRKRVHGWYWFVPLAVIIWALMYTSGVHATVVGLAMGLILRASKDGPRRTRPAEHIAHLVRPLSAGVAVPLFALFAAGVDLSVNTPVDIVSRPEPLGVALGLTAGKTLGIFGGAYLAVRFTHARLSPDLAWADVFAVAMLAGIGFTVSLLIGELSYSAPAELEHIKAAVLLGSVTSAFLACLLLRLRNTKYRRLYESEGGADIDGVAGLIRRAEPVGRQWRSHGSRDPQRPDVRQGENAPGGQDPDGDDRHAV